MSPDPAASPAQRTFAATLLMQQHQRAGLGYAEMSPELRDAVAAVADDAGQDFETMWDALVDLVEVPLTFQATLARPGTDPVKVQLPYFGLHPPVSLRLPMDAGVFAAFRLVDESGWPARAGYEFTGEVPRP